MSGRIASLAADFARYATRPSIVPETRRSLIVCGERSQDAFAVAMAAYATDDTERARQVASSDDRLAECIDALRRRTINGVFEDDVRNPETRSAEHVWVLLAVRDIERITEQTTKIAERVIETGPEMRVGE